MCWDRSFISSSLFGKLECLRRQSRHTQTNLVTTVQCGHWAPPQTSSPKIYTRRKWILNPPNGWQPIHSRPYWMEESLKEPVDYYYIATSDVKHPTQINTPEMQQQSNKSYTHVLLSFFTFLKSEAHSPASPLWLYPGFEMLKRSKFNQVGNHDGSVNKSKLLSLPSFGPMLITVESRNCSGNVFRRAAIFETKKQWKMLIWSDCAFEQWITCKL